MKDIYLSYGIRCQVCPDDEEAEYTVRDENQDLVGVCCEKCAEGYREDSNFTIWEN